MNNEDVRFKALIDEILGANAVTPGRAIKREELLRPDVREEILFRLYGVRPRGNSPLFGPGMLPVQPKGK